MEVLHVTDATPDRGGAIYQGVLRWRARDAQLEREHTTGEASRQFIHRVLVEAGLGRWRIELREVQIGAPNIQARKEVVTVEAHLAAFIVHEPFVGRGNAPCRLLFVGQSTPAAQDSADVVAVGLLLRRARIVRWHERARDLAVTRLGIDYGALPASLWNRADFHVISGT